MLSLPSQHRSEPAESALRRPVAVGLTALSALIVCALLIWLYFQSERSIHRFNWTSSAISDARKSLDEAFLNLSLHESDADTGYRDRAGQRIQAAVAALDSAITLSGDVDMPKPFRERLAQLRGQLGAWIPRLASQRFTDESLQDAFALFSAQAVQLDDEAQLAAERGVARLDYLFVRSIVIIAAVMIAIVSLVIIFAAGVRRSLAGQRRAEAESSRRATLLNAIADGTTDAVFVKDREGRYLYANRATAGFVGKSIGELIGKDDRELFAVSEAEGVLSHDTRLMAEDRSETSEETLTTDGIARTYLTTKGPLHDDDGNVIGLIGVSCDISSRKKDEQALRESEKRLALALAAAHMGVWSIDLTDEPVFWSPELYEMTGFTTAPQGFKEFLEMVLPEDRERVRLAVETAIEAHAPYQAVFRFRRPDGEIRWLSQNGEGDYDEAGAYTGMRGAVFDVTDRIVAEEALRASQDRYRRLLDLLPDAVFLNEDDRVAYCNPAYLRLRGAALPSEVIGTPVFDMFPEESHELIRERIESHRRLGYQLAPEERQLRRLDGRLVPVFVSAMPLVDAHRKSILVVLRDLSRERRADAWAQSILSHTLDGIISTDQFGTITSFNTAAEQSFGYTASEVIGRHIAHLVPDTTPADVGQRREMEAVRKDGVRVPVDVAVSAFELEGEVHIIAVARDVSEQRKLQSDLRQAHKMEALGQVAGGVAHDFNNLLTVILGYSDILHEQFPEGDPRRQFASDIRRASGRAADLTRQLLTFSRRTVIAPKVIDVNLVMKDMNRMLRRVLGEDIVLSVALHADVKPVFIDPGSLEQIVMNLCVNARDAMPTGGQLTISTSHAHCGGDLDAAGNPIAPGEYVRVTVADTGEGMSPDVLAHIFEPFFTTKGAGKGTGLGLAVVLGLVEQNGGHIHVDTVPQRGTEFTVALPIVDAVLSVVAEVRGKAPRGGGEMILVVEDEEPVRRLAVIALASAGYRVLEAADGRMAIEVFDQHRGQIDLVITDVVMPHLGGRELVTALQVKQPGLRVIYTSGYADDAVLRHGISRAEVDFLAKPYTPSVLLQKARDVIDQAPGHSSTRPPV